MRSRNTLDDAGDSGAPPRLERDRDAQPRPLAAQQRLRQSARGLARASHPLLADPGLEVTLRAEEVAQPVEVVLEPGDLVVVCSDGVTEARNTQGDEYGHDRLTTLLAHRHGSDPADVLDELIAAVNTFAGREPQADDITALVLRYRRA